MLMSIYKDFLFCKLTGLKRIMDRELEDHVSSADLTPPPQFVLVLCYVISPTTVLVLYVFHGYHIS